MSSFISSLFCSGLGCGFEEVLGFFLGVGLFLWWFCLWVFFGWLVLVGWVFFFCCLFVGFWFDLGKGVCVYFFC